MEIIKRLPLEDYFNYFNELLADNPPFEADSALIARIAEAGIGAGKHFSLAAFDEDTQQALNNLTDAIYKELDDAYLKQDKDKRTTEQGAKAGDYKTDYYGRALVAYKGLGALPPEEAVYYLYTEDGEREILDGGKHNYRLHFEKGQTPPAQAFWSYTVYGKDRYLVENPIRRFAIGDRSQLKYNADGSLDLYLNAESPGKDKEANWLPTPEDTFFVALRIYVPHEGFLKDRAVWNDPLPEKINYFPPVNSDEWESLPSSSLQWNQPVIDSLYGYPEEANTKAFILLYDGRIVLEKYFHGHTPDKTWYWASAGKSLTAFLIGIAQQEKYLSIADPASRYPGRGWTSATPEQESKITIRHQLTMTSGLNDGHGTGFCTDDSCLTFLSGAGTRWAYHNAPYTLLDRVLQKATGGHSLSDFVRLKLKDRTGIDGAYHPSGYNRIFFSTARCMARYGLLVLNEGVWNGDRILTDTAFFRQMVNTSQPLNRSYGYPWWLNGKSSYMQPQSREVFDGALVPNAPPDMIAALGMNGQIINVTPSRRIVVIRMGDAPPDTKTSLSNRIWEFINRFEDKNHL